MQAVTATHMYFYGFCETVEFLTSCCYSFYRLLSGREVLLSGKFFFTLDPWDNIAELRKCNRGKYEWLEKCDTLPLQHMYNDSNSPQLKFCTS